MSRGWIASRQMLAIARNRCPGVRFHQGSLVDFNLRRRFDVITCLFGALAYAKTMASLRKATRCFVSHLQPGGVLIVEPWVSPERFVAGRLVFDRVDDAELKVARMYITKRRGAVSVFDSQYPRGKCQAAFRISRNDKSWDSSRTSSIGRPFRMPG